MRREPILAPSINDPKAPDHTSVDLYGTVIHDAGKYRMWYMATHHVPAKEEATATSVGPTHISYAESDDGNDTNFA